MEEKRFPPKRKPTPDSDSDPFLLPIAASGRFKQKFIF
jgi:hypothetical protein